MIIDCTQASTVAQTGFYKVKEQKPFHFYLKHPVCFIKELLVMTAMVAVRASAAAQMMQSIRGRMIVLEQDAFV